MAIIATTFLMNLFHGGRVAAMPPKLMNDDGELFLNRSVGHVAKADCDAFAMAMQYPVIPCDLCGSQGVLLRQQVKQMIDGWDKNQPVRCQTMLMALTNAQPLHLLDSNFFDFLGLQTEFIQN